MRSSYYSKVIENIKNNRERRLQGKLNCIPWKSFPKLSSKIPGIEKETYVICTANSKIGKTQFTDFLYVLEPYKFIKENPDCGIKLKIFYFSLEISKEKKLLGLLSNKIYNETGKIISAQNINSKFENYILTKEELELIEYYKDYFEEFEQTVTIIDNVRNPFGIYKYMRTYAETYGYYVKKTIDIIEDGIIKKEVRNDYYVPNDPDELIIVITDSVNLLGTEVGLPTLGQAMNKFSSDYCLHMRDKWKYCVVNIQQQSAESEKQQYTNFGTSVVSKLKPTADGLGDSKLTGRDCNLMMGLFAPHRYDIQQHNGYDIKILKDNYRELIVILNRDGETFTTDLLFNGAVNHFEQAPDNINRTISQDEYNRILKRIRV